MLAAAYPNWKSVCTRQSSLTISRWRSRTRNMAKNKREAVVIFAVTGLGDVLMPRGGFFTSSDVSWMSISSDRMWQNTVANRPRHFVIWTVLPNVNVSGSWLAPACLFLRSMLKPIQDSVQRTVSSSNEFLGSLSRQVPEDYETAIIDAKNLCLSINWDHLTSVLTIAAIIRAIIWQISL